MILNNKKTALFCGSFNPVTKGHVDIITRAAKLCDKLIVAVMNNGGKTYALTVTQRLDLLKRSIFGIKNIEVIAFEKTVADLCAQYEIDFIIKAARNALDLQYEMDMADINNSLCGVDTVYLAASKQYQSISSSIVRDLAFYGKDLAAFVPKEVEKDIASLLKGK